jgi:hypothetical protein
MYASNLFTSDLLSYITSNAYNASNLKYLHALLSNALLSNVYYFIVML